MEVTFVQIHWFILLHLIWILIIKVNAEWSAKFWVLILYSICVHYNIIKWLNEDIMNDSWLKNLKVT